MGYSSNPLAMQSYMSLLTMLIACFFLSLAVIGGISVIARYRAAIRRNLGPVLLVTGIAGACAMLLITLTIWRFARSEMVGPQPTKISFFEGHSSTSPATSSPLGSHDSHEHDAHGPLEFSMQMERRPSGAGMAVPGFIILLAGLTSVLAVVFRDAIRRNLKPVVAAVGVVGLGLILLGTLFFGVVVTREQGIDIDDISAHVAISTPLETTQIATATAPPPVKLSDTDAAKTEEAEAPKVKAPPRPKWMDKPIGLDGNVYRAIPMIGPFVTPEECEQALPQQLQLAARQYVQSYLAPGGAANVQLPLSFVEKRVKRDQWIVPIVSPTVGPMVQMHVLLEFGPESRQLIDQLVRQRNLEGRMTFVGLLAFVVLGLVTIVFAYLKTDLATGGRHHGLLRAGAAVGILFLLLVGLGMLAMA